MTQVELSDFLNVSYQQIQKYEAGRNRLPIDSLYKLKDFLDVPFEHFFVGVGAGANAQSDKCIDIKNLAQSLRD